MCTWRPCRTYKAWDYVCLFRKEKCPEEHRYGASVVFQAPAHEEPGRLRGCDRRAPGPRAPTHANRIISFAVWDVAYVNRRKHGPGYAVKKLVSFPPPRPRPSARRAVTLRFRNAGEHQHARQPRRALRPHGRSRAGAQPRHRRTRRCLWPLPDAPADAGHAPGVPPARGGSEASRGGGWRGPGRIRLSSRCWQAVQATPCTRAWALRIWAPRWRGCRVRRERVV